LSLCKYLNILFRTYYKRLKIFVISDRYIIKPIKGNQQKFCGLLTFSNVGNIWKLVNLNPSLPTAHY